MVTQRELQKRKIPYVPLIMYHDEVEFMVPDEYAEEAKEIGIMGYREGPKLLGINIMDGGGKIGKTWYDVH